MNTVKHMHSGAGLFRWIDTLDSAPWGACAGRAVAEADLLRHKLARAMPRRPLYSPAERARRDASPWTLVQGVLAPLQFLVFLVSLVLVMRYAATGAGWATAAWSVVVKTAVLYTIMVTGAIWERVVFGRYLFAPAFFYEDLFSMLVLALHTAYVAALFTHALAPHALVMLALSAYAAYVINAGQFVLKLRAARLEGQTAGRGARA